MSTASGNVLHRPRVIINVALDALGGMVGSPISDDLDWKRVHLLRATSDGVCVGCRTWNIDHPRLTARPEHLGRTPARQPRPVVFAHAGLPDGGADLGGRRPVVVGPRPAAGFEHVQSDGVDLSGPLAKLGEMGMRRLLVEGGPTLVRSFLEQGTWDTLHIFVRATDLATARRGAMGAFDLDGCSEIRRTLQGAGVVLTYAPSDRLCHARYTVPTDRGPVEHHVFLDPRTGEEVTVIEHGRVLENGRTPLARIHSACFAGENACSRLCDCGPQFRGAVDRFHSAGGGLLIYMHGHEGRGIGLLAKASAYELKALGLDTVDANIGVGASIEDRRYDLAARALRALGVGRIALLTNNPEKLGAMRRAGLEVDHEPISTPAPNECRAYLKTKVERMNHDPALVAGFEPIEIH